MIRVRTFPRIHMTLIDLAGVTERRFGGAGFSLDTRPAVLSATGATKNSLSVSSSVSCRDRGDLEGYLARLSAAMGRCFRVELEAMMPQHVGLGSKTAVLLAMGLACNEVAEGRLDRSGLVQLSRRGGTSGVGVNATFTGGFVVDGGRRRGSGEFQPSSAGGSDGPPPVLVRLDFPAAWHVHLFLPRGAGYFGRREETFFSANTPIGTGEVYDVLGSVYHGLAPAVAETDLVALRLALERVHAVGFKRREVEGQSGAVRRLLDELRDAGMAAGMSSLGPLVYAIGEGDLEQRRVMRGLGGSEVDYLGCVGGRNRGYELAGMDDGEA